MFLRVSLCLLESVWGYMCGAIPPPHQTLISSNHIHLLTIGLRLWIIATWVNKNFSEWVGLVWQHVIGFVVLADVHDKEIF